MNDLSMLGPYFPGSRIGVILIHGLTGTPTELTGIAKNLNRYGFSVLCPLLAGHCSSEEELLKTNWQDWYASVEQAYQQMFKQTDVIFVGGISAGAVLSLHLAINFPDKIRALSLYSTTLGWDGWAVPKLSFLLPLLLRIPIWGKNYRFEEAWPYGIKNEKLRQRVYNQMQGSDPSLAGFAGTPGRSLRELWRLVDIVKAGLPQIKTPTLLVHASDDDMASIRNAIYIKENINAPSRLVAMDNSYHMITIDQERHHVSLETAHYFYSQLSEQEKTVLFSAAASEKAEENLLKAQIYPERPKEQLLSGLSKKRNWVK